MMNRVIAVLGMHRSGTSCLTGMLENAGVVLGSVSRHNRYNVKGNNEHQEIVDLHESLLADNNASWGEPPKTACVWQAKHYQALEHIIAEYKDTPIWGFKDPRALFTLEGWLECLPELQCVGSFRHPVAVADSLLHRAGGGDLLPALEMWQVYNQRLLYFQERLGFDLICFDAPPDEYIVQIMQVAKNLELKVAEDDLVFFDKNLRKQKSRDGIDLPEAIQALYQTLLEKTVRCDS